MTHSTAAEAARTVQDYIDETPRWADGTPVGTAPMTPMQWWIWSLAAAGKFFEGLVVFMTGVAMPLIGEEFGVTTAGHGLVAAATLGGILAGALLLGGLADTFGRKTMFIGEMAIFLIFLVLLSASPSFTFLVIFLFGMGVALGCDYPTAHLILSESTPSRNRGRLVLGAFGFQAIGALIGTAIGFLILKNDPEIGAWRWMYASAIVPAALVLAGRFFTTESAHWLLSRGRIQDAEREMRRLLARRPAYPKVIRLRADAKPAEPAESRYAALLQPKNLRALILAAVPWFLQDLGTYGIGIFTPTILAASLGHPTLHPHNIAGVVGNDILAAKGAALIDALLIIGIVCAIFLADRVGRIPLQILGFLGCAAGLLLASFSADFSGGAQTALIFAGFMLFNFMTNLGPNAQTYLIAGEVFPTAVRGKGAGLAAAFAKIGAVLTAFLFPILLVSIGTQALLYILVATSLAGAAITWLFRIETTGVDLESLED